MPKPKATVSRHNSRETNVASDEDEQRERPCSKETDDVDYDVYENSDRASDSDESDSNITKSYESDMHLPLPPSQELSEIRSDSIPEYNSDDSVDMNWSDVSERDEQYCDSSSDDGKLVCGENSIQMNESTDKDPYLYPGSPLKLSESVLLILTLAVTHNLNGSCLSDVISLINLHCIPGPLNKCVNSLNELKKYFADLELPITKHFYCNFCYEYIGVLSNTPDVCPICDNDVRDPKKKSYFVILSVENQLKELMQSKYIVNCAKIKLI